MFPNPITRMRQMYHREFSFRRNNASNIAHKGVKRTTVSNEEGSRLLVRAERNGASADDL